MNNRIELEGRAYDERPWGNFDQICLNKKATVKIIEVNPGEKLSVQKHQQRDEFWKILDGPAKIYLGEDEDNIKEGIYQRNDEIFIQKHMIHSIEALDKPVRFLEVAFGYFDEDDIERLEDRYGRTNPEK